jgi:hypothetical protein
MTELQKITNDGFQYGLEFVINPERGDDWMAINVNYNLVLSKHYNWMYCILADGMPIYYGESGELLAVAKQRKDGTLTLSHDTATRLGTWLKHYTDDRYEHRKKQVFLNYIKEGKRLVLYVRKGPPLVCTEGMNWMQAYNNAKPTRKHLESYYITRHWALYGKESLTNKKAGHLGEYSIEDQVAVW